MEHREEDQYLEDMGITIFKSHSAYKKHEQGSGYYWGLDNKKSTKTRLDNIKKNGGTHTDNEIWAMYSRQDGRCNYCEIELNEQFEKDHIIPISKGGRNDINNIQILCKPCNRRKGVMTHDEYVDTI